MSWVESNWAIYISRCFQEVTLQEINISHQTGKGKSSTQNAIFGGYVSSLEGNFPTLWWNLSNCSSFFSEWKFLLEKNIIRTNINTNEMSHRFFQIPQVFWRLPSLFRGREPHESCGPTSFQKGSIRLSLAGLPYNKNLGPPSNWNKKNRRKKRRWVKQPELWSAIRIAEFLSCPRFNQASSKVVLPHPDGPMMAAKRPDSKCPEIGASFSNPLKRLTWSNGAILKLARLVDKDPWNSCHCIDPYDFILLLHRVVEFSCLVIGISYQNCHHPGGDEPASQVDKATQSTSQCWFIGAHMVGQDYVRFSFPPNSKWLIWILRYSPPK